MSVTWCMSVWVSFQVWKPRFPMDWRGLVKEFVANICIPLAFFKFLPFQWFFCLKIFLVCGSLQTSLLCIVGKLAGGRSVAFGVSDRWHVTHDTQQMIPDTWNLTPDTWHMPCDIWQVTPDRWHMKLLFFSFSFLSVYVRFGIGATIRIRQEFQCLQDAGFFWAVY